MSPVRVGIAGCCGRMGRALVRLLAQADPAELRLVAAATIADDPNLGRDVGTLAGIDGLNVPVRDEIAEACDTLIEFTTPAGTRIWAGWCAEQRVALISGTTGIEPRDRDALAAASAKAPVLWAPNMSIGVNLLLKLTGDLSRLTGDEWNVEIVETHHNQKADAPSGTARALLEAVCRERGIDPRRAARFGREGQPGERTADEIGVHAVRLGGNPGEHEVHFATAGEVLTLRHRAGSRDIFAAGALRAARWLAGKPPGRYTMQDVLDTS